MDNKLLKQLQLCASLSVSELDNEQDLSAAAVTAAATAATAAAGTAAAATAATAAGTIYLLTRISTRRRFKRLSHHCMQIKVHQAALTTATRGF